MGTPFEGVMSLTPPSFSKRQLLGDTDVPLTTIYETNSSQEWALGTKLIYPDGRVFRYAKNGAVALAVARMCSSAALNANGVDEIQTTSGGAIEVGDREITIDVTTGGTWVNNEYVDGYMIVNKSTGMGDIYRIVANEINASDDTLMKIQLETDIRTALAATTEVTLVKNKWRDVIVMPTTVEGAPAGVPLVAVTASYYCWLQTGGYAPIFVDDSATVVKGNIVGFGNADAGACEPVGADTTYGYGVAVYVAAADEPAIIDLNIDC